MKKLVFGILLSIGVIEASEYMCDYYFKKYVNDIRLSQEYFEKNNMVYFCTYTKSTINDLSGLETSCDTSSEHDKGMRNSVPELREDLVEDYIEKCDNGNITSLDPITVSYCKANPTKCGIVTAKEVDFSTLDNYVFKNNTWHLLDYEALLVLLSSFNQDNSKAVKAIWSYDGGQWSVYSFDNVILETIQKSNMNILNKIQKKKGYWALIQGDNPDDISTINPDTGLTEKFQGYGKFDISSKLFDIIGNEVNLTSIYSPVK